MHIKYKLFSKKTYAHILCIDLHINNISYDSLVLKLPVWIPGSYLVREFAKNIDYIIDINTQQRIKKTNKNTWIVDTKNIDSLHLQYHVYGFDWSVRTNHINEEHAFVNAAASLLYIENHENIPIDIEIVPDKNWNSISSNLEILNNNIWQRRANNIHDLYDSVFEIGNQQIVHFNVKNTTYEIAMYGNNNCNTEQLIEDLKKIIASQIEIFGHHPCEKYLFIIQHRLLGFGGLEHLNASVNQIPSYHYQEREKYRQAIGLLSHEHFHLWNVKRIKPKELLPYQYEQEQYTELLWFFEGITSYYDDLTCYRAGVFSKEEYLEIVEKLINEVVNHPGNDVQTLAEASFDAWIKYYRQTENSINSEVSYYRKGAVVALLIDLYLIYYSDAKYCLDNIMQILFAESQKPNYSGLTKERIIQVLQQFVDFDWNDFYENYIENTRPLPVEDIFNSMEFSCINNQNSSYYLGLYLQEKGNSFVIKQLDKNYGAYKAGLQVNDIIVEVDTQNFENNLSSILQEKNTGDIVIFKIERDGSIHNIAVTLTLDLRKNYSISKPENISQNKFEQKWLMQLNVIS
ncbi:MAG: PDZ domain-containing protein [Sphingobacteriales bacterium]|nr:MAG: PDZ domain-containing protein [Sphingobacteriales bacterium]